MGSQANALTLLPAAAANALMGTWHLPLPGFSMPDVESNFLTRGLHDFLLRQASNRPLASFRALSMAACSRLHAAVSGNKFVAGGFFNGIGDAIDMKAVTNRPVLFPGLGIDVIRNHAVGLRDLDVYTSAMPNHSGSQANPVVYLYDSYPGAWFDRLRHAYFLNIEPAFASGEAQRFAENHFLSKVFAEVSAKRSSESNLLICDGRKNPDEIAENLHFLWAGQSYGGTFAYMAVNALQKYMSVGGYKPAEIQSSLKNCMIVSISGALPLVDKTNRPSVQIAAVEHVNDFVGFQSSRIGIHPKLGTRTESDGMVRISDQRVVFWQDFSWKTAGNPQGVAEPSVDSYGYHDIRAVLPNTPERFRRMVQAQQVL